MRDDGGESGAGEVAQKSDEKETREKQWSDIVAAASKALDDLSP